VARDFVRVLGVLVEGRLVESLFEAFEANVSPWHSAPQPGAVRLLATEVPGPCPRGAVGPVPALRSELESLHQVGLPNAGRALHVTADGTTPSTSP
jgi:hypothetical protein